MNNVYFLFQSTVNVYSDYKLPCTPPQNTARQPGLKGVFFLSLIFLCFFSLQAFAQNRTVTGRVTAASDNTPLPGVNVLVKGTTNGTTTDPDGVYSLSVPSNDAMLVYSFIGYTTQEVPVGAQSTINVQLRDDVQALQEVVVVGYGTQKKEDLTGSVVAISSENFNKGQVTTPEQLLLGKVAGVQINQGGAPGASSRIRIRGGSSLNASNDPLIVIDGVPVDNSELKGSANALSLINPNDIETFNILKDASATAIYGARASNGVIIITTKKGRQGDKLRVDFSSLLSLSTNPKRVDVLSADEFRAVVNERSTPTQIALLGNANTDWQDLIYRNALTHDHNLSVSGSFKSLPYRVSVGYLDQDGILKTSSFERTSGAISLNPSFLNDHLKVNLNLKGSLTNNRFADQGAIGAAVAFDPTQPVYSDNNYGGYFEWINADGSPNINATRNPLSLLEQRIDVGEARRSIGNLQLDYKFHFLPDLRANLNVGYDLSDSEGSNLQPATMAAFFAQGGNLSQYSQKRINKLFDFYLNYTKDITAINSRIDATAGYSYQDFLRDEPAYPTLNSEGDTITRALLPFKTQYTLIGFFGRLNYTFMDRYLLTANIRRDGSSRFGQGNKWGVFPSLALAWKINEEAFLKNSTVVSELKLRLGYGVTGQQDLGPLGDYPFLARYTYSDLNTQYQFGNQFYTTLRPEGYDADIKWEETQAYNAGFDYGFLDGRISGSVDYYFKKTKDLLARVNVPAGSNLTNQIVTNVGNIENEGLEAALNFTAINTEKLKLDFGINGTYNTSKITNLSKVQDETAEGILVGGIGGVGNTIQIHTVGYQPYSFYVYKQVYDENGSPIEDLYVDLNNDGVFNNQDKYRYKNPEPRVFLGFNSQVTYNKWSAGFVMRGSIGNYVYNNVIAENGIYNNISALPGFLNNINRNVYETNFERRQLFSDYYVQNASFLRMETINLGYNFGRIFNDKADLRLSANIQNAFVITKYTGLDPETQTTGTGSATTTGIDNNLYPRPRIFSFGVNLGF